MADPIKQNKSNTQTKNKDPTILKNNKNKHKKDDPMLKCTNCKKEYSEELPKQRCSCGEPLQLPKQTGKPTKETNTWKKYQEFYKPKINLHESLGEGQTPLKKSKKLSNKSRINIYLKNETINPTWSFKDRGTFIAIQKAKRLGYDSIGTVSTGNMAASVAAYGAHNNLKTTILVPEKIPKQKLKTIKIYNPQIIKVKGNYGKLYQKSLEIQNKKDIYFINSDNPYRVEGYKTIAYEIINQTEETPDYISIPTSSGGLFRGIIKGLEELKDSNIIEKIPKPIAAQTKGCAPIHQAHQNNETKITKTEKQETIAKAIANPNPPSGNEVLRKLKQHKGQTKQINNQKIQTTQKELAKEGIFAQPASTTGIAATKKLKQKNKIKEQTDIISIITGAGLKYMKNIKFNTKPETIKIQKLQSRI